MGDKQGHKFERSSERRLRRMVRRIVRRTKGSGSGMEKGDIRIGYGIEGVRIECKYTSQKSYRLTGEVWRRVVEAAEPEGNIPVLELHIEGSNVHVAVVPIWVVDWLVSEILEGHEEGNGGNGYRI